MNHIRASVAYEAFIAGRDVDSAAHREDGSPGYCIGIVNEVREGDEAITPTQYLAELDAITAYNAALPPPPPPPMQSLATLTAAEIGATTVPSGPFATVKAILAKADADITAAEIKTLVLMMARYFFKKWVVDGWR